MNQKEKSVSDGITEVFSILSLGLIKTDEEEEREARFEEMKEAILRAEEEKEEEKNGW